MHPFLTVAVNVVAASGSVPDDKFDIYSGLVDEIIRKCEAKACISNSNCEAIRKNAALACMKSAYFKAYKNEFITKMIEQNIDPKPHKVSYFLNQCFFDVVVTSYVRKS